MLYVKIPKEIKEYEEKVLLGLTVRQIIWGVIAIVLGVAIYAPVKAVIGQSMASYVIMVVVIPCFACGWLKIDGMAFDKYIRIVMQYYSRKQVLLYETILGWIGLTDSGKEKKHVSWKEKQRKRKANKAVSEWQTE